MVALATSHSSMVFSGGDRLSAEQCLCWRPSRSPRRTPHQLYQLPPSPFSLLLSKLKRGLANSRTCLLLTSVYLNVLVVLTLPTSPHNHHHNGAFPCPSSSCSSPPDALSGLTLPLGHSVFQQQSSLALHQLLAILLAPGFQLPSLCGHEAFVTSILCYSL